MLIKNQGVQWYVDRLASGPPFAQVGYSDAEWYCMYGIREGETTGLGQVLSKEYGKVLLEILKRRQSNPDWLFAVPSVLTKLPIFTTPKRTGVQSLKRFIQHHGITTEFVERDRITDDLARDAGLFPLIQQFQRMRTVLIGPKELSKLDFWGKGSHAHVAISSPNLHQEEAGIREAVDRASTWYVPGCIYLVSAGLSAAPIIDQLYERFPRAFYFDCGSIWDAFVGIGGQREWRAKLYKNPTAAKEWVHDNLFGKS